LIARIAASSFVSGSPSQSFRPPKAIANPFLKASGVDFAGNKNKKAGAAGQRRHVAVGGEGH
jgi:hypothetical protein